MDEDPAFRRDASEAMCELDVDHLFTDTLLSAHEELTRKGNGSFDAMVIDIGRPSNKGLDFLRQIRAAGVQVPLIFSSRRESADERVRGLELGADDYIAKPFEWRDLLARLRAVVRRQLRALKVRVGVFEVNLAQRSVVAVAIAIHDRDVRLDVPRSEARQRSFIFLARRVIAVGRVSPPPLLCPGVHLR